MDFARPTATPPLIMVLHHCILDTAPIPHGTMRLCVPEYATMLQHVSISGDLMTTFPLGVTSVTDWVLLGPTNGNGIVPCGYGAFCCYGLDQPECCSTSSSVFSLGEGTILGTANPTIPEPTFTTATTTTSGATSSTYTNTSLPTSSISALVFTQIIRSIQSTSIVGSAVAAASSLVSPTTSPSTNHAATDQRVAIGIGVGVAVGLVILAGLLYALLRRFGRISEAKRQSPVMLYVDGKAEMDAAANHKPDTGAHELTTHTQPIEIDTNNVLLEVAGSHGPRAEID